MKKIILVILLIIFPGRAFALQADQQSMALSSAPYWDNFTFAQRVEVITETIRMFEEAGVMIRLEPEFYVEEIEWRRMADPDTFIKPIGIVFRTLAVIFKDFDNGEDPDEQIKDLLGSEFYQGYARDEVYENAMERYYQWKEEFNASENR